MSELVCGGTASTCTPHATKSVATEPGQRQRRVHSTSDNEMQSLWQVIEEECKRIMNWLGGNLMVVVEYEHCVGGKGGQSVDQGGERQPNWWWLGRPQHRQCRITHSGVVLRKLSPAAKQRAFHARRSTTTYAITIGKVKRKFKLFNSREPVNCMAYKVRSLALSGLSINPIEYLILPLQNYAICLDLMKGYAF